MATRRTFFKVIGAGAAWALSPATKLASMPVLPDETIAFAVVRSTDTAAAVKKAVSMLGGMEKFIAIGDVVFVKPNISWDKMPEQAATTNPIVVETVVALILEAGAKKVIVADNTCNDARRSYKRSGISEAAERAGAEVLYMEARKFVKKDLGGDVIKQWEVYKGADEADKIINLPVAKHHGLSNVTLSMKNLMGLIGGRRDLLHQKLPECVVDLTAYFKPNLTILDAVRILKANGPQGSTLNDVVRMDTIAASTDPVKIDAFGISLFTDAGFDNDLALFPHIALAEKRGLGTADFRGRGYKEVKIG